jgi:C4-dicarboxylate transporter
LEKIVYFCLENPNITVLAYFLSLALLAIVWIIVIVSIDILWQKFKKKFD